VALRRGQVPDEDFDRVRAAGWTDAEIAELLAHVALSTFTNYFAVATGAEIDSPVVRVGESLAA
jgi:alkylhydroperoxidase family enzyme